MGGQRELSAHARDLTKKCPLELLWPDAERRVQPVVPGRVILECGFIRTSEIAERDFADAGEHGGQHEIREAVGGDGEHPAPRGHEQVVRHDGSARADHERRREEVDLLLPAETRRIDELWPRAFMAGWREVVSAN